MVWEAAVATLRRRNPQAVPPSQERGVDITIQGVTGVRTLSARQAGPGTPQPQPRRCCREDRRRGWRTCQAGVQVPDCQASSK